MLHSKSPPVLNPVASGCTCALSRMYSRVTNLTAKMMRAIRVKAHGGPEVLKLDNVPLPKDVGDDQVLVKILYAGVNPVDTYIRAGTYARLPQLPYTPGIDAAGVISVVGSKVKNLSPGQRVFIAYNVNGTYGEYAVADLRHVFPLPSNLSFSQGAAIGAPYFTAYKALIQKAHAKAGDVVLVHGASGAVGIAAVQIARQYGMTVIGTAGTPEGEQLVKSSGAHHVFNHRQSNHADKILEVTNGRGVDVVVEMLANVNLVLSCNLLASRGIVLVVGSRGAIEFDPRVLMGKEASVVGVSLFNHTEVEWSKMVAAVTAGLADGWLKPVVHKEYVLEEASQAHHDIIASSGAKGKLVLKVASE